MVILRASSAVSNCFTFENCYKRCYKLLSKQMFYAQIIAGDEPDLSSKEWSREGDSNPHALAGSGF